MTTYARGSMNFDAPIQYGAARIETMSGDEPGYAGLRLVKIELPPEALSLAALKGIRVLEDGTWESLDDAPGRILFGTFKGNRPLLA